MRLIPLLGNRSHRLRQAIPAEGSGYLGWNDDFQRGF
jgi:hypothetical protein